MLDRIVPMSNPNIVPRLEDHRSYIFCVRCEDMGHEGVEMRKDGHRFICPLQHELDIHTVQRLVASGRKLHMVPLHVIENPSPNMVEKKFWIFPQTYDLLKEKFAGRFIVTMDTFFNLLADGNVMFIIGPDVEKLRGMGLHKPQDIIAALEGMKEREEFVKGLTEKLAPILNAASAAQMEG